MFGLLISGRFVDTSFREVDATHCVIDIPDSSSFSYVVVSIATLTLTRYIITLVNIHLWQFRHWLTKMYFALPNVVCSYNMKIFYKDWNIKRLYLNGTLWYITNESFQVFLTGQQPFPDGMAGAVYFCWPPSANRFQRYFVVASDGWNGF